MKFVNKQIIWLAANHVQVEQQVLIVLRIILPSEVGIASQEVVNIPGRTARKHGGYQGNFQRIGWRVGRRRKARRNRLYTELEQGENAWPQTLA